MIPDGQNRLALYICLMPSRVEIERASFEVCWAGLLRAQVSLHPMHGAVMIYILKSLHVCALTRIRSSHKSQRGNISHNKNVTWEYVKNPCQHLTMPNILVHSFSFPFMFNIRILGIVRCWHIKFLNILACPDQGPDIAIAKDGLLLKLALKECLERVWL
jgi:hypothetical protein